MVTQTPIRSEIKLEYGVPNPKLKIDFEWDTYRRPVYVPGDFVGVEGGGILTALSAGAITPRTKLFHFLLIGDYIPEDDDYVILESIGKGVAVGRLSWYADRKYQVFRVNHPDYARLGKRAAALASKFGRHDYDYFLFARFLGDFVRFEAEELWTFRRFARMFPGDFRRVQDSDFICTELVVATWALVGVDVIHPEDAPVPAAFVLAERAGRIVTIDRHSGDRKCWRIASDRAYEFKSWRVMNRRRWYPKHEPVRKPERKGVKGNGKRIRPCESPA